MGLGIRTRLRRLTAGPSVDPDVREVRALLDLERAPAAPLLAPPVAPEGALHVAFVVPTFRAGSGGHMAIANLVRALEHRGHHCSLWIEDAGGRLAGAERAEADLRAFFGPFAAEVSYGAERFTGADVVLATGWQTVARVRTMPAAARAYLVQDHEPEFFGTSVQRTLAERSYAHGLYPITAGAWLARIMHDNYGLPATPYDFGIDGARWRPQPEVARRDDVVVAYARASTPRRAVPVVLAALEELRRRRPATEVWLYGHGGDVDAGFPHRNLGVLDEAALARVYAEATVGLVLSLTNYSLAPQEMLACGLPCVELDAPSVVASFGADGPLDLAPLDPEAIAGALARLLDDPALRARRAEQGARLRSERTWDAAAARVEEGLRAALDHARGPAERA